MDRKTLEQIAAQLGAKPAAVLKWRQRQVPYRWRLLIEDEAKKRGLQVDRRVFCPNDEVAAESTR